MTGFGLGGCCRLSCRVCSGRDIGEIYEAREMMQGTRTRFHYAQCSTCGTLWLTDPPVDYSLFYPNDYYSFVNSDRGTIGLIRGYLRAKRDLAYFQRSLFGEALARRYPDSALISIARLHVGWEARILDVGCGSGSLLRRMAAIGFKSLAGIDPFLSNDSKHGDRVRIRKCRLEDLRGGEYDVVMFHHSLEHVEDPVATLQVAARLLAPGGKCVVRLPVLGEAWQKYGTNWVQLDPPRHMWVPTERAMRTLAASAGLGVKQLEYDSTEFQFWGSELYARDVPFETARRQGLSSYFDRSEISRFRERAATLNQNGLGDSAMFVLSSGVQ